MIVGISVFELHIPHSRSLKQKRKVVKGLVERIHNRFKVSIIESDHHDLHQRSEISIALVALNDSDAERIFDSIRSLVDQEMDATLLHWDPQLMDVTE